MSPSYQTLATVLEATKIRTAIGPSQEWYTENLRYYYLVLPTTDGAIRNAVLGLRSAALLQGFRGKPVADLDALVAAIRAVADTGVIDAMPPTVNPPSTRARRKPPTERPRVTPTMQSAAPASRAARRCPGGAMAAATAPPSTIWVRESMDRC